MTLSTPPDLLSLAESLGLHFQNPALLWEALTHLSYYNEHKHEDPQLRSYERLEFLGDAILELVAAELLFRRFPKHYEGQLTMLRAQLTRTETLADFSRQAGLDQHIRLGRGDEAAGARQSLRILGNVFEALIAAIYLDQGLEVARAFILRYVEPALLEVLAAKSTKDSKTRLQEWWQAQNTSSLPSYQLLDRRGPVQAPEFWVEVQVEGRALGQGRGRTIRQAEQMAAQKALEALGVD
jgi:ribonuclease III